MGALLAFGIPLLSELHDGLEVLESLGVELIQFAMILVAIYLPEWFMRRNSLKVA